MRKLINCYTNKFRKKTSPGGKHSDLPKSASKAHSEQNKHNFFSTKNRGKEKRKKKGNHPLHTAAGIYTQRRGRN